MYLKDYLKMNQNNNKAISKKKGDEEDRNKK